MRSFFTFIFRNKFYYLIEVIGLSLSLAFILPLLSFLGVRWTIDHSHPNWRQIYEVCPLSESQETTWGLAEQIRNSEPDVTAVTHFRAYNFGYESPVYYKQESFSIQKMVVDRDFFGFFPASVITGDLKGLEDRYQLAVSESFAARSGINCGDILIHEDQTYSVCAIFGNYHESLIPDVDLIFGENSPLLDNERTNPDSWWNEMPIFIQVKEGTDIQVLTEKLSRLCNEYYADYYRAHEQHKDALRLRRYDKVSSWLWNTALTSTGGLGFYFMSVLAVVLIIFSLLNCTLLNTALTTMRAKEMATRRLFGSSQTEISLKLIVESTLMVAFCFAVGLALAFYFQDAASELFRGKISLKNDVSVGSVSLCLGFILFLGFVSGILPSWHISSYQPIDIVKGSFRFHSKMVLGRLFIIVQNVVTIIMLTAALVIWLQLNHLIHAPLGFNTENLFYVESPSGKSQTVRNMLEKMPFVERVGCYQGSTFTGYNFSGRSVKNSEGDYEMLMTTDLDKEAFDLLGLKIIRDNGATNNGYYLNGEALRLLGYTGEEKEFDWGDGDKELIAGTLQDFRIINVLEDVRPMAIRKLETVENPNFLVKTNGDRQAQNAFRSMLQEQGVPEKVLQYYALSMEENIAETFEEHQNTLDIITLFTLIAIVISVMGYVGMSLFFIRQRQKEIAIRKVMGSTSGEVLLLMLRTFSIPMLISFVIAVPISWYIMNDWLSNFSYRIALSPWIFAAAGFTCFIISLLTVIFQSWRAASENPINNIKTE